MSVGGARNAVETVGELDGHYDGVFGAARAEPPGHDPSKHRGRSGTWEIGVNTKVFNRRVTC